MKKLWIKKFNSHKEAEKSDLEHYAKMSHAERLDTMQFLREIYYNFKGKKAHAGRGGLRRVIKVIQQA